MEGLQQSSPSRYSGHDSVLQLAATARSVKQLIFLSSAAHPHSLAMTRATTTTHPNRAAFPPGISGPALRALQLAGIHTLDAVANWTKQDLAVLHGMGPKALAVLKTALAERKARFGAP